MQALNHIFRLIWSDASQSFVAVAETTRGRGKRGRATPARRSLQAALLFATGAAGATMAAVLPTDGAIKAGSATITQTGNVLTVNQSTAKLITEWQQFNIGAGGTVNFVQPSSSAVALNRVLGNDVSTLQGALNANGHVFIVNPNGVMFTKTAQVQTGGLVASTLDIANGDFLAGRHTFSGRSAAAITNAGSLRASSGGTVALVGTRIINSGSITANQGNVLMGAGNRVTLDLGGSVKLSVEEATLNAYVEQGGAVRADGGQVMLTTKAAGELSSSVINHSGITEAHTLGMGQDGRIVLSSSHAVVNTGTLSVKGSVSTPNAIGGQLRIDTKNLVDAGTLDASSDRGVGGSLRINASGLVQQTNASHWNASGATQGGSVRVQAGTSAWLSGYTSAAASQGQGGELAATADDLTLAGARLDASGASGGGRIRVGGGWQGSDADLPNAQRTRVVSSDLDVSATNRGRGGIAVVWADGSTTFGGRIQATGGRVAGDGGQVEVSGKGLLTFGGAVDAKAYWGRNGTLLLDPKNIEIVESISGLSVLSLPDPSPSANEQFGSGSIVELLNGGVSTNRIVVASGGDDVGATDAGAVYVYNSQTGALVSTLIGSSFGDGVGSRGITSLNNGNYVVVSPSWANGSAAAAGAVTWGNGSTGTSGVVSAANSLVGSALLDLVGGYGVTALSNGNYVVRSIEWDNGGAADAGAVTWGNGSIGTRGVVSASNSLVGSQSGDRVGVQDITVLSNGNYVVASGEWANGSASRAGAVTWGNGRTGTSGVVSATNSVVGGQANDLVGFGGVTALSNGNYVSSSMYWRNGAADAAGAVTWGNGTTGTSGIVSVGNSLVGGQANDFVGGNGIVALQNGNYVVVSRQWANGSAANAGAVTWGNGIAGTSGLVSSDNSLVGSQANSSVGYGGITPLTNGNYVVNSNYWRNDVGDSVGAVTWANGRTGTSGVISASNSLVGSTDGDRARGFGVVALSNGNYVVRSFEWDNGGIVDVGAVTWGDGATGTSGVISASNSLVGSTANDRVGSFGITALSNGNYVVNSSEWANGTATNAGAVTWGNGATGTSGVVSASNSLVGTQANDFVGFGGITALSNGNYVVGSRYWRNGSAENAGAVTWGNGSTGTSGVVSAANSLVGTTANDLAGSTATIPLSNGNYVVASSEWHNGGAAFAGAVTWGNGRTGTSGPISASNSLVGSTAYDYVGSLGVAVLSNGNYVVASPSWTNGSAFDAGAATWGNGRTGTSGVISASNSLVGSQANDGVGSSFALGTTDYLVLSAAWANGSAASVGAITVGNGSTGTSGLISADNSLLGGSAFDRLGGGGYRTLSDGRWLVASPDWDRTGPLTTVDAGRLDILGNAALANPTTYATNPGVNSTFVASNILALLNAGTNVVLQANNDIKLSTSLVADNPSGNGGALTLQAGRSLLLNGSVTTDNGNLTLIANDTAASGVVNAERDPGAAAITMANGTSLNVGTGAVSISLRNGAGNTHSTPGVITLGSVTAGSLAVESSNFGGSFTADNKVYDGTVASAVSASSLSGLSFTASSNLRLSPISASFADFNVGTGKAVTAAPLTVSGFNGDATAALTLNGTAWQPTSTADISPRAITVTADTKTKVYGNDDPTLTYTITSGSLVGSDSLGALTRATGESVGSYVINASALANGNYLITAKDGTLSISPRPITVTAEAKTKTYGDTDPSLTYTVTSGNLVGSDSLGALTRATGENVGSYVINASALVNGNYLITAANGILSISQRPISVTADDKTKSQGDPDPALTYRVTAGNLVGTDTLSGALTRLPGEAVATYVIDAAALSNGNYLITAINGTLRINQRTATLGSGDVLITLLQPASSGPMDLAAPPDLIRDTDAVAANAPGALGPKSGSASAGPETGDKESVSSKRSLRGTKGSDPIRVVQGGIRLPGAATP